MNTRTHGGATAPTAAAVRAVGTGSPRHLSSARKQQLAGWLFLTPAIAYLLFAFALPIVYNVMLSFERTSPATIASLTAPFAKLDNYRFILSDPTSRKAIANTFWFTAGSLAGQFLIGFALALLFSMRFPGRTLGSSLVIVCLPLITSAMKLMRSMSPLPSQVVSIRMPGSSLGVMVMPCAAGAKALLSNLPIFSVTCLMK